MVAILILAWKEKFLDLCTGIWDSAVEPYAWYQPVHRTLVTAVKMTAIRSLLPVTVHNRLSFVVKSRVGHYPISIWLTEIASVMGLDWISVPQHVCTAHAVMSEHFVFCEAICRPPSEEIRNYDKADLLSQPRAHYKLSEMLHKTDITRI
jgi:hypothetical protein